MTVLAAAARQRTRRDACGCRAARAARWRRWPGWMCAAWSRHAAEYRLALPAFVRASYRTDNGAPGRALVRLYQRRPFLRGAGPVQRGPDLPWPWMSEALPPCQRAGQRLDFLLSTMKASLQDGSNHWQAEARARPLPPWAVSVPRRTGTRTGLLGPAAPRSPEAPRATRRLVLIPAQADQRPADRTSRDGQLSSAGASYRAPLWLGLGHHRISARAIRPEGERLFETHPRDPPTRTARKVALIGVQRGQDRRRAWRRTALPDLVRRVIWVSFPPPPAARAFSMSGAPPR